MSRKPMSPSLRHYNFSNNKAGKIVQARFIEYKGVLLDDGVVIPDTGEYAELVFKPKKQLAPVLCDVVVNPELSGGREIHRFDSDERIEYGIPQEYTKEELKALKKKIKSLDWVFRV